MGGFGTGIMLRAALTPILGIKAVVPILALAGIIINGGLFGFLNGLASGMGSWIASRLVHKLGAKLHIVVIEALIVVGGSSIDVHGLRAL